MPEVATMTGQALSNAAPLAEGIIAQPEMSNWFVCALGIGIVFIGLLCLIVLVSLSGAICRRAVRETPADPALADSAPAIPAPAVIPNKGELVAALSAALAEELGRDVRAIRILKIERV